jgi:S-DNA-T family DNA segregation ATPase FtsK/SpoIIIE
LAPGIRVNRISSLSNDLAMALSVISVRVEAPIPGMPYVGIEIPNTKRRGIPLRMLLESEVYQRSDAVLPLPMGVRVDSSHLVAGLEGMPHILVAGTTGSGKSVFTNTCIIGMCSRRTPHELRLILIDPKHVEFAVYDGLPHLLAHPVSDPKKAVSALAWAVQQMEERSEVFARVRVRNLESYNEKVLPKSRLPYIVIVVDELADLMYTSGKEVESYIARLAQKARAAGIHMILATQRPSVDVITGIIKANVPARVAFAVPSQTDSRTIIDTGGADKLLGKGDMLFLSSRFPRPVRLQASFIDEEHTMAFIENLKTTFGAPEYIEFEDLKPESGEAGGAGGGISLDPKLEEALEHIMDSGIASASRLQTLMGIGYPRASRIVSTFEQLGILGPQPPSAGKPREILMDAESARERLTETRQG